MTRFVAVILRFHSLTQLTEVDMITFSLYKEHSFCNRDDKLDGERLGTRPEERSEMTQTKTGI